MQSIKNMRDSNWNKLVRDAVTEATGATTTSETSSAKTELAVLSS